MWKTKKSGNLILVMQNHFFLASRQTKIWKFDFGTKKHIFLASRQSTISGQWNEQKNTFPPYKNWDWHNGAGFVLWMKVKIGCKKCYFPVMLFFVCNFPCWRILARKTSENSWIYLAVRSKQIVCFVIRQRMTEWVNKQHALILVIYKSDRQVEWPQWIHIFHVVARSICCFRWLDLHSALFVFLSNLYAFSAHIVSLSFFSCFWDHYGQQCMTIYRKKCMSSDLS